MSAPLGRKPAILLVDDDQAVLAAVERDMKGRYGSDYLVLSALGGEAGLDLARDLKTRGVEVALLLVDQRMPHITGLDLLARVRQIHPAARRVLLTAYSDTRAAIQAINEVGLHHYLLKPWHPPEENLFPVIDEELAEWLATRHPEGETVRVIGHRWSSATSRIKDFLASTRTPYRFLDLDRDPEAVELLAALVPEPSLPAVVLADGTVWARPTARDLATAIGLRVTGTETLYDLAIIGAGPAGLAAAVYGSSEGLRTVVIERWAIGGQAMASNKIENYLGFPGGISGIDLARRASDQAHKFNAEILTTVEAVAIRVDGPVKTVVLDDGTELSARAVLITTGMTTRTLDVPGFAELSGLGIYYGTTRAEAASMAGEEVIVIGGANSAGQAAVMLASAASRVHLVVRAGRLEEKMSAYLVDQIRATENIVVLTNSRVAAAHGSDHLTGVTVENVETGEAFLQPAAGVFVFIGAVPHTEFVKGQLALNPAGFILTGADLLVDGKPPPAWPLRRLPFMLETSIPGVFAAGDVRHGSVRRVAAAVGAGSAALTFIHEYLASA